MRVDEDLRDRAGGILRNLVRVVYGSDACNGRRDDECWKENSSGGECGGKA